MIRLFKTVRILYLIFFLVTILLCHNCFADFRFGVAGDSRGEEKGINEEILKTILKGLKSEEVKFVVFVGDMVCKSANSNKSLLDWKGIVEGSGMHIVIGKNKIKSDNPENIANEIPVYIVVGNHEEKPDNSGNIVREIFKTSKNGNGPKLFYPFDWGKNAHFVVIDTNEYNNSYKLGKIQMKWLEKKLIKAKGKIVFVFGHEPAYPVGPHKNDSLNKYPFERDKMWKLFKKYQVYAYFCGHEHLYNMSIHEGICQIITGGAGAPIPPDITPEKGGFRHFIIVDVKDSGECQVTVKAIEVTTKGSFIIKNKP